MKTVFYETNGEDRQLLSDTLKAYPDIQAEYIADKLSADNIQAAKDAEAISVFVGSEVKKQQIDAMPNLKLIATRSTGFDHIDVAYAKSKNITVCNVPAYGSRTVAEFAFALILSLSRKLFVAADQIKEGKGFDYQAFEGFNLQGKTIGIVGTGRIGLNVAQIAKGFDMDILGFVAFPNEEKAKEYGFKYVGLDELLSSSDIVTLHVPYMKETHHLINKDNLGKISAKGGHASRSGSEALQGRMTGGKKAPILINTARGEVVDTEALLMALKDGTLGGAGLDVLEGERQLKDETTLIAQADPKHPSLDELKILIEDHALINMPNVIITPHIAFYSKEAKHEILKITAENIINFKKSQPKNTI